MRHLLIISLTIVCVLAGCGVRGRLATITRNSSSVTLGLPYDEPVATEWKSAVAGDTLELRDVPQEEVIIMKAVKDEEGEMVATDVISAAMVSARFRNVAERHGKVDLRFRITVPSILCESRWQIRFHPNLYVLDDTLSLDPVIVTGQDYRKAQLRGYQQYERYIGSIISDESLLIDRAQLEVFLKRNLPQVYAFRSDTTVVSDERFYSAFGVSEQEAVAHYVRRFRVWRNERKKSLIDKKFRQYVKVPIVSEGLRLDTVIRNLDGDFIYDYVQTLNVQPKLRKAEITLSGNIFEQDKMIYSIPEVSPLTYYISSLSTLADGAEKYVSRIVERRVEANTACYIAFNVGRAEVVRNLGENDLEISRIEKNLNSLARNEEYDLDSIVVTASASPEGSYASNASLTTRRSAAVATYFQDYLKRVMDSLAVEPHMLLGADGDHRELPHPQPQREIHFISRNDPENWRMLDAIVGSDSQLTEEEKRQYFACATQPDPDVRERQMQTQASYLYIRQNLYPRLRTVKFDFFLHRKGMEQDTLHTTMLDTTYMKGVQAIKDRDYKTAVSILRPYHDYNTAVAYCSLDYNASALEILQSLDETPQVDYLLAIVYSRMGRTREARERFARCCEEEPSFRHRGNLDPEISELMKNNKQTHYQ